MKRGTKALLGAWGLLALLTVLFYWLRPQKTMVNWVISHIVAPIRETVGLLTSWLPFSVAELLYTILILGALLLLAKMVVAVKCSEHKGKTLLLRMGAIALIPAILVTGYNWLWALGYYGSSFAEKSGMTAEGVSVEDLTVVTAYFAKQASILSEQVARDAEGHFAEENFWNDTEGLYASIEQEFPFLQNRELRPKPMLYSRLMSWLGFTGFYFPFTGEANVNVDFPAAQQPSTICHELAHQRRVAAEQEANFVGIAAGISSGKTVYQYSAYLSGLTHLSNALYKVDREAWSEIRQGLHDGILVDWRDNSLYWDQFESPVETVATTVYDSYLKHNDQVLGIQSYGACVDLLVQYYIEKA